MSDKTATERLRALLDERGVEYTDRDMFGKHVFHWGEPLHGAMFTDGGEWTELVVESATPEQAIAATLGDSDAAEVVRCRDCACFSVDDSDHDYRTGWWCKRWYTDMVMPDGFCAWGKRKDA